MSEIALISSRKSRLETAAKKGSKSAKTALDLANSPNKFLSAVQIGITLIGILTGIYSGDKITEDVEYFVSGFEAITPYAHSVAVGIVVVVLTFFSLVLGELLPKRIGLNHPESIAKAMAMPMKIISIITAPFIWLLTTSTEFLLKILQIKPTADGKVTEEEIKTKVLDELHSVYPVCEENLDEVVGVVFLKDLFANFEKGNFNLRSIAKEPSYFIEHTSAYKALENFKKSKVHYAFVTDEYGVFQGIITLNDILEALVGDASDFDDDEYKLIANEDGSWLVDGQYSLHDFLTYFDMDELTTDYEVTTVSGFIITELGAIPKEGDKLIWNKLEFEAQKMDGVKIDKVLITTLKDL